MGLFKFLILSISTIWCAFSFGMNSDSTVFSADEIAIAKSARERTYPGGHDEENLEVQSQIIKPIRKEIMKSQDVESSANDDEF